MRFARRGTQWKSRRISGIVRDWEAFPAEPHTSAKRRSQSRCHLATCESTAIKKRGCSDATPLQQTERYFISLPS